MALLKPTDADVSKLHAEVNQIANQRFLLTTLAITLFGAVTAWQLPREPVQPYTPIGHFRFGLSILMNIVLFVLYFACHLLTIALRNITTYLDFTKASNWEVDWRRFRKKGPYVGYLHVLSLLFVLVGGLSTLTPLALFLTYKLSLEPVGGAVLLTIVGVAYLVFVVGMGYRGWFDKEDKIRGRWEQLG